MMGLRGEDVKRLRRGLLVSAAAAGLAAGCGSAYAAEEASAASLTDIRSHWAEQPIAAMAAAGMIGGYPDGTFRPEEAVTRAQFLKLAVTAMGLSPVHESAQGGNLFEDVPAGQWAAGYVAAALKRGIILKADYAEGHLVPDGEVTRAEMAGILARALGLKELTDAGGYTDTQGLPGAGWIGAASRAGVMNGYEDGAFRPGAPATRAQAAVTIARMAEYLETGSVGNLQAVQEAEEGDGAELLDRASLGVGRLYGTELFLGMKKKEVGAAYGAPLSKGASEGAYTLQYPRILQGRTVTLHFPYHFDELEEETVRAYSLPLGVNRETITGRLGEPEREGEDEAYGGYYIYYRFGMYDVFFTSAEPEGGGLFTMKVIDRSAPQQTDK
ncbi:S-layer homology domain-containing protein [Paenibacillus sp. S-38]|uniref:S-layer homology domain-containing protein n=1 Tax=Paenibacillus sp. S-38 TaxID=3416710 RepID=UPI003CEBF73D